jgi:hypothetical protein
MNVPSILYLARRQIMTAVVLIHIFCTSSLFTGDFIALFIKGEYLFLRSARLALEVLSSISKAGFAHNIMLLRHRAAKAVCTSPPSQVAKVNKGHSFHNRFRRGVLCTVRRVSIHPSSHFDVVFEAKSA